MMNVLNNVFSNHVFNKNHLLRLQPYIITPLCAKDLNIYQVFGIRLTLNITNVCLLCLL